MLCKCMSEDFVKDAKVFGYLLTPTCILVTRVALARVLRTLRQHLMVVARDPKFSEECLVTKSSITLLGVIIYIYIYIFFFLIVGCNNILFFFW